MCLLAMYPAHVCLQVRCLDFTSCGDFFNGLCYYCEKFPEISVRDAISTLARIPTLAHIPTLTHS